MTKRGPKPIPDIERFWPNVEKTSICWIWRGRRTRGNYAVMYSNIKKSVIFAHRFSYELAKGPVPEGKELDHTCENPPCVNPDHLEAVTHQENIKRSRWPIKTHCPKGHPFIPENLVRWILIERQRKVCRICANANQLAYNRRKRKAEGQ